MEDTGKHASESQPVKKMPRVGSQDSEWLAWAQRWASWDPNPTTKEAVLAHVEANDIKVLRNLLSCRLEFGTAGLRGPMGAGSSCMNDLVIVQTTQGVCAYLESCFGPEGKTRGVCIGFDHRSGAGCNSRSFAQHAAAVFSTRGFKVFLYDNFVATPMVPWCMENKQCCAGIMITASHNPAADNGYKLYWENGAQIVPPHDAAIASLIEDNLEPWVKYSASDVHQDPNCICLGSEIIDAYFTRLASLSLYSVDNAAMATTYPITYTAMHGVGCPFVKGAFDAFGHDSSSLVLVESQVDPDPTFPTVAFPNPEEGKGALELAFRAAEAHDSCLILASDPDADRLAVAERKKDGSWHVFTGNEIGALLGHWSWVCWRQQHPTSEASQVHMIGSTVSSKFLASVAAYEGFNYTETLTGFKWMGSKTAQLRAQNREVIFAFEEAIGFCIGNMVKDKDGISAAAVFAEMAKQLHKQGATCLSHLDSLYTKYGYFLSFNSYVKCLDPALTQRIFAKQRGGSGETGDSSRTYPEYIGDVKLTGVRDLTVGYDSRNANGAPDLPLNTGGEMITYYLNECEAQITLRSSGTEPKIKFYSEMRSPSGGKDEHVKLIAIVRRAVDQLLDPDGNNLQKRPEDEHFWAGEFAKCCK